MAQNYDSIVAAEPGLQYYWKLAEAAGTTNLAESVAGVNNGTVQGGVTLGQAGIPGSLDTAALFDGATGYVSTASQVTPGAPMTMETWCKTTYAGDQVLMQFGPQQTGAEASWSYSLVMNGGTLYFTLNSGAIFPNFAGGYNDGVWHHVVGILSANNNMALWVDGILRASNANTTAPSATAGYWRIGGLTDVGASHSFNGTLAQAAVYNVALSASQIGNHSIAGHNYAAKGNTPNANASAKSLNTSGISKKSLSTIVPGTTGAASGQLWPL